MTVSTVIEERDCASLAIMDTPGDEGSYVLADIAARSSLPARTIRFYQSVGVLPKPDRRGRVAIYREEHLERLRVIAELRDRGLTLAGIRDLLDRRVSPGVSVGDWLGLDSTLRGPWSEDRPRLADDSELADLLGRRPPGLRGRLEQSGYLHREPDGSCFIPSPALLDLALRLQDAGIDVEVTGQARDLLTRRLARAIDDLIALFVERTGAGFAGRASADELDAALDTLRPIAREAAGLILAHEVERGLRSLLEAGPSAVRPRRSATKRTRPRPSRRH